MQKSSRSRPRRRRANKNKGNGGAGSYHTTRVPLGIGPRDDGAFVPPTFRTSLRIAFERNAAASTSIGNINLKGNDVFDPLATAGTAQPVGFDYLALLYNRYRVIGSRIEVRTVMANQGDISTVATGDLCVFPSNITVNPASMEDAVSQPYAKNVNLTSNTPKVITHQMATSKLTGQRGLQSVDRLTALVSASPAEEWFWIIAFRSDVAYTTVNMNWIARITYDVEFYDRAYLGLSSLTAKAVRSAYLTRIKEQSFGKVDAPSETKETGERKEVVSATPLQKPAIMVSQGVNPYAYVTTDDPDYVRIAQTPSRLVKR